jgi:hypothetical protein
MSPRAKSVAEKLLAKGAKIALVGAPADQRDLFEPAEDTWSAMMFRRAADA